VIIPAQAFFEITEPALPKDVFDDFRNRFVLIDSAIAGLGEKPEPGTQGGVIDGEIVIVAGL